MKKFFIFIIFLNFSNLLAGELRFECENGSSYKITHKNTLSQAYFKYRDDKWSKIDRFLINNDRIEFFIPNLQYLACSDKNLTICNYSKVISDYKNPTKAILTDVVQNDCYIGTMGCNFYQKGLVLNQVFCSVIKK